ncbi:MAG: hypothetical protein ACRDZY_16480 [Acidimicrobiales bacterium]
MKVDWLRERRGSGLATFATATPITNTIAEMYVMQRFLQPETLARAGVAHFDAWAANFGRTVTALELSPDCASYRMNARFARFANVPDLLRMFRAIADVRTADELALDIPELASGRAETVVVEAAPELSDFVAQLAERAEAVRNRTVLPEDDNMLNVSGDGRKAALDLRLVGLAADPAGDKIAAAADKIAAAADKIAAAADKIANIYSQSRTRTYTGANGALSPRPGSITAGLLRPWHTSQR